MTEWRTTGPDLGSWHTAEIQFKDGATVIGEVWADSIIGDAGDESAWPMVAVPGRPDIDWGSIKEWRPIEEKTPEAG